MVLMRSQKNYHQILLSGALLYCQFQEEKQKAYKREKRKERKRKAEGDLDQDPDPDMAAMMGFSGFGGSKK